MGAIAHSDIIGKMSVPSLAGNLYVMVIKDEASSWREIYVLKDKSAASTLRCFKDYVAKVKASSAGRRVIRFRSDWGREYRNKDWDDFLLAEQIVQEEPPPISSESNGFVERENRTLLDKARSLLFSYELPQRLWAEAVNTAAYLLNRLPFSRQKEKTPFELWHGKKPDVSHLKVFGCDAFRMDPHRKKLDPRSKIGRMVGYGATKDIFRVFDPHHGTGQVFLTRDVLFDEESYAGRKRVFDDFIPRQDSERAPVIQQVKQRGTTDSDDSDSSGDSSDTESQIRC